MDDADEINDFEIVNDDALMDSEEDDIVDDECK